MDHVGSVGSIDEDVNIAEEDLKFLRDVAEMRYVQNFVTLTPTVAVDAKISEKVDVDEVVNRIETRLETEFEAAAEGYMPNEQLRNDTDRGGTGNRHSRPS